MAYTDHPNGAFLTRAGNYNVPMKILDQEINLVRYFDTTVDNLTNALFYKIFSVPAGFSILEAYIITKTVEGETGTLDLVDDDSATTSIISNANMENLGVTAISARLDYLTAGFICLRADHALEDCKFYVNVKGIIHNISM